MKNMILLRLLDNDLDSYHIYSANVVPRPGDEITHVVPKNLDFNTVTHARVVSVGHLWLTGLDDGGREAIIVCAKTVKVDEDMSSRIKYCAEILRDWEL